MENPIDRYISLGINESLCIPFIYPKACNELAIIIRSCFVKSSKPFQSLMFDHTLLAFNLLPQMQTQSAGSAANLLLQSVESAFPKQKRVLAATVFKQSKIAYKRRGKVMQDDKDPVNLPQDVLVHLFCFLDVQSLLTGALVCRLWNAAANDSYLWEIQYKNYFAANANVLKLTGLPDSATKPDTPSNGLCIKATPNWKDDFRKAYLGLQNKFDRGFCLDCNSIVWIEKLKCPNQCLGQSAKQHQLKPLSPTQEHSCVSDCPFYLGCSEFDGRVSHIMQIGRFIVDGLHVPRFFCSDSSDSDVSEDEDLDFFFSLSPMSFFEQ